MPEDSGAVRVMTDKTKQLSKIAVGDRVWIKTDYKRIICLVRRLTPTQILVDWPWASKGQRFERGKKSRYGNDLTYWAIGYHGFCTPEIQAIATASECEQYDAQVKAEAEEVAARTSERKEKERHRDELGSLFGRRMVSVSEAHHVRGTEWHLNIYLTTEGVTKIARLIDALSAEELPSWEE